MKKSDKSTLDIFMGILFIFILVVIPAIVKLKIVPVSSYELGTIRNSNQVNDVFSYYKSTTLIAVTVFMMFSLFIDTVTNEEIKLFDYKNPVFILTCIYFLFMLLSCIFSKYKTIAFKGISERYEGFFVLTCYMILMITAMFYTKNRYNTKFLIAGFLGCIIVVGGIGLFQYFGMDIFETDFVTKIVFGKHYTEGRKLTALFDYVYSTLYNPNCVGLYASMMLPFVFMLALFLPIKFWLKYVAIILSGVMFVNFMGCGSAGAFVGVFGSLAFICIVSLIYFINAQKKRIIQNKNIIIGIISIIIIVFASIVFFNSSIGVSEKFKYVLNMVTGKEEMITPYPFEDLKIEGNKADIYTKEGILSIIIENKNPSLLYNNAPITYYEKKQVDENGNGNIDENETGAIYKYNVEGFNEVLLQTSSDNVITLAPKLYNDSIVFLFKETEDGNITILTKDGKPFDISEQVPSFGFKGIELLGSGRGFIWSRSIPLIKNNIIIGKGPDTFTFEFPQYDVLGKLKYFGNPYIIVDKPHNMYIQMIINTGFLSVVAVLGIFILYIIQTIRCIINNKSDKYILSLKFAFLAGILGYLFNGLTTDSVVSVAPIFWIMLGTGFAVNKL